MEAQRLLNVDFVSAHEQLRTNVNAFWVLRTRPTRGHKVQKHYKNLKTYVQDIPLSPYAYHFQLMISLSHQYEDNKEIWITNQREGGAGDTLR